MRLFRALIFWKKNVFFYSKITLDIENFKFEKFNNSKSWKIYKK